MLTISTNEKQVQSMFREYAKYNKRSIPELLNQKLYWILAKAVNYTKRVLPEQISKEWGVKVNFTTVNKRGKAVKKSKYSLRRNEKGVPVAALEINRRRGKKGLTGLTGNEMDKAVGKMIRGKRFSVGFGVAGWFVSLKKLRSQVKAGKGVKPIRVNIVGKDKGTLNTAKANSLTASASAINHTKGNQLFVKRLTEGLNKALIEEYKSMQEYVTRKLEENALKAGFKKS